LAGSSGWGVLLFFERNSQVSKKALTTLITGASAGIGAAFARVFAREGHNLILVARSSGKLATLAEELKQQHGIRATVIVCDLADPQGAQQLYADVKKRRLSVDILVNNAGLLNEGKFSTIALDDHLRLMQVNMAAVTALSHLFLADMLKRGSGRILNNASTSAFQPAPLLATYAASKAFVLSLGDAMRIELMGTGVTLTTLCPGFTETDMIVTDEGEKMKLPFVRHLSPEEVAEQGFSACMAGKDLCVPGVANNLMSIAGSQMPRWLRERITRQMFRGKL
jgi:short-subunit dehydrogenase